MNIASFMVLVMPWDSLPTMEKLQFDGMTHDVGMVINGGGVPKMFLVSVPKGPSSLIDVLH